MLFIVLAGLDTANAVYRRFFDPAGGKIGISAHMGGLLAGKNISLINASSDAQAFLLCWMCFFFK